MSNILYIIGNGFDLMHKMPTNYENFLSWLLTHNRLDAVFEMQSVFQKQKDGTYVLWSDFETALGNYDMETAAKWDIPSLYVTEEIIGDQKIASNEAFFLDVSLNTIVKNAFRQWGQSIPIATERKTSLPENALYLTFNYTDTLEVLYGIAPKNVLHIHGRISLGEVPIVGHRNYQDPLLAVNDDAYLRENNERIQHICDMNDLYKPIEDILKQHNDFFLSLKSIETIEIVGHSCNKIDHPYFEKIVVSVGRNANWIFHYHDKEDLARKKMMASTLGINNVEWIKD